MNCERKQNERERKKKVESKIDYCFMTENRFFLVLLLSSLMLLILRLHQQQYQKCSIECRSHSSVLKREKEKFSSFFRERENLSRFSINSNLMYHSPSLSPFRFSISSIFFVVVFVVFFFFFLLFFKSLLACLLCSALYYSKNVPSAVTYKVCLKAFLHLTSHHMNIISGVPTIYS